MEEVFKKTIVWDTNTEPPKNYIWVRGDGKAYEFDRQKREWVVWKVLSSSESSINYEYGDTSYWNSREGYVPEKGSIIVYEDYKTIEKDGKTITIPGIKIASGDAYVQDLPFIGECFIEDEFYDHIKNKDVHTTLEEKEKWNNKVSIDESRLNQELLIFKTD